MANDPAAEARFRMLHERIEVTYLTRADVDAWYAALADHQKLAIDKGAAMLAEEAGISAEWARGTFMEYLAAHGSGDD